VALFGQLLPYLLLVVIIIGRFLVLWHPLDVATLFGQAFLSALWFKARRKFCRIARPVA
jgi:hypothetical protein